MNNRRICSRIGLLLAVVAVGITMSISCGGDNPTGPAPVKDYPVYFSDGAKDGWFFEYHPIANTVDSFYLGPERGYRFSISANGKRMYLERESTLDVVDLKSHTVVKELPFTGATTVSADNDYLAVVNNGIRILQTSDLSIVYEDTLHVAYGSFSADSRRFYCPYLDPLTDSQQVAVIDARHGRVRFIAVPTGPPLTYAIPSTDESRLFLWYDIGSCASAFMVYDLRVDSILYYDYLNPGKGDMLVSPNGRLVYYSNPGPAWSSCFPAPSEIYVCDIASNTSTSISTLGIVGSPYEQYLPMGELAITPDNRWLCMAHPGGFPFILRYDIRANSLDAYINVGRPRMIFYLACQSGI